MTTSPLRATMAALFVAAALSATAAAQPTGEVIAPRALDPRTPAVAVNASGRAVVAWTGRAGSGFAVYARLRAHRTAAWSPPARISAIARVRPPAPVVAVAPDGSATAVWRATTSVTAAHRGPSDRTWRRRLVANGGAGFTSPAMAAGAATTVVWADRAGDTWRAHRATLTGDRWRRDAPFPLMHAGHAVGAPTPRLSVGGRGDAAVTWSTTTFPKVSPPLMLGIRRPGGATWETAGVSDRQGEADVAVSDAGHVGVAWVEEGQTLRAAVHPPGSWADPDALAQAGGTADNPSLPRIAVNHEGYALVAWAQGGGQAEGMSLRARTRSGANGLWSPPRVVHDGFVFHSILDLATVRAAVDPLRVGHLAWFDPEGPGSATVYAARTQGAGWRTAAAIGVGEDVNEPALAASGRGGAMVVTPRVLAVGGRNVELVARSFPAAGRPAPRLARLESAQRVAQAAIRRVNAVDAVLNAGVPAARIRPQTITASHFGADVHAATQPVPPTPPPSIGTLRLPIPCAPPTRPTRASVTAKLAATERIIDTAIRRANATRDRLGAGLTGGDIADGAIGAHHLAPGVTIVATTPGTPPVVHRPAAPGRASANRGAIAPRMAAAERTAQVALLRANWLVERIEGGISGDDIRPASLGAADLSPALRGG